MASAAAQKEPTQLPLMQFEGRAVDEGRVSFGGSVSLFPNSVVDIETLQQLAIGTRVRLVVDCYVGTNSAKAPRDKEGVIKQVRRGASLTVESLSDLEVLETL